MTPSPAGSPSRRIGLFLLGARGAVSTCVAVGVSGLRQSRFAPTGMVTARAIFDGVPLVGAGSLTLGGMDVRGGSVLESARALAREGIVAHADVEAAATDLAAVEAEIVPGILDGPDGGDAAGVGVQPESRARAGRPPRENVAYVAGALRAFRSRQGLDDVVVVNLASTEAARPVPPAWAALEGFEKDLDAGVDVPASTLYAYAALGAGFPYVNFTPSLGANVGALEELARRVGVPHAGCDGKTGETLVKTVLAPLFRDRNLDVLAWEGYNMLGNGDGRTLSDPAHRSSKIGNKDRALRQLLGDRPDLHTRVSIDYVPSLGDWKTAWDFVHFRGFFGTRMTLQFTWMGSDSALAAPLVLDLTRLAEFAHRRGESGAMRHTAAFFKSPIGCTENDFHRQNAWLEDYARAAKA